jgi:3-dehydroquinate synthase
VGDLAGFAAATYQRGVGLWQIPTTVLAQVDSSVGGKTAIDLKVGKNLVGAFYQPCLVVVDPLTLGTLPEEEYASGLGEVVKHCLLMGPKSLSWLEEHAQLVCDREPETVARMVRASLDYKVSVVQKDEKEAGGRAVLNLGHTVAHAIEVTEGYGSVSHGRAVGLGLLVALAVSEEVLGLESTVRERTRALLARLGLPTTVTLPPVKELTRAAGRDKKARAGTTGFVGLRALGEPVWGLNVPEQTLAGALEVIRG